MYQGSDKISQWKDCGMRVPEICDVEVDEGNNPFDRDPFECGDDIILPNDQWKNHVDMMTDPVLRPFGMADLGIKALQLCFLTFQILSSAFRCRSCFSI